MIRSLMLYWLHDEVIFISISAIRFLVQIQLYCVIRAGVRTTLSLVLLSGPVKDMYDDKKEWMQILKAFPKNVV